MNFLKTLFWVVLAVSLAIFAFANWDQVGQVKLWGGQVADIKLPVLILLSVLIGFLPPYLILRGRIWNLRRKLALAERPNVPPPPSVTEMLEAGEGPAA